MTEQTFYRWRSGSGGLRIDQARPHSSPGQRPPAPETLLPADPVSALVGRTSRVLQTAGQVTQPDDPNYRAAVETARLLAESGLTVITGGGPGIMAAGKIRRFPVVLYNSGYWRGLLAWLQDSMLAAGNISAPDIDLMRLADSPQEVHDQIWQGLSEQASWCEKSAAAARAATRQALETKR